MTTDTFFDGESLLTCPLNKTLELFISDIPPKPEHIDDVGLPTSLWKEPEYESVTALTLTCTAVNKDLKQF